MLRRAHPRGEHGFTLVETLVALVMGVVVMGALFAILEVTLHQSSRVNDRAQATQLGRVTMTKMVNELHSACIAPRFSPVQEKSGESTLIFRAAVGSEAVLQKEKAAQHEIIFTAAKGGVPGTLVDKTYAGNGGEWPNFTYSSTASTVKIGEYIYPTPKPVPPPASEPVFKYFKYSLTTPAASSSTPVSQLTEIELKGATLTAAQAQTVAAVQITFTAGAVDGNTALNRSAEMSNLVNFSFTVPTAETPIEASPCE